MLDDAHKCRTWKEMLDTENNQYIQGVPKMTQLVFVRTSSNLHEL